MRYAETIAMSDDFRKREFVRTVQATVLLTTRQAMPGILPCLREKGCADRYKEHATTKKRVLVRRIGTMNAGTSSHDACGPTRSPEAVRYYSRIDHGISGYARVSYPNLSDSHVRHMRNTCTTCQATAYLPCNADITPA